ncbi:ornithine carbamoyltransferase [Prochlorothrix hollandica]|uniref:Ornithine carbamoyltransferase n=1 Tax=Prochlorothrix hollandica PCC 9006 = CALU 1027 TaxID=317619 RepID=A0A0M2PP58_PROHO|nr:ornithine carbamoyltransferase [Prochlorothrix hollandica]KKI98370.1 ornithine carbamoyltransferase [Prochlorothrix hollandica PCC 9006 = CALU 1027]
MGALQGRDLLTLTDLTREELRDLLQLAIDLKTGTLRVHCQKTLGLLFSKASTRTRVSFSTAMFQLGGQVIDLNPNVTQVGRGEPIADTARVLSRYLDVLAIRTFAQADLVTYAEYADIPVINALTDQFHPCQILADLLTLQENFGSLQGLTLSYFGDGNNMAHSLMLGCALTGVNVRIATPAAYQPQADIVELATHLSQGQSQVLVTQNPQEAAQGAQALYTDVWASMGQESESLDRIPVFQPYQVNEALLDLADSTAIVLHCLPAHRDEEITAAVLEGPQSRVWDQAENRLHGQKALLASVLEPLS